MDTLPPEIPEKLNYQFLARSYGALWQNDTGEYFIDVEIEFARTISLPEKAKIAQHFALGFEQLQAQHEYCLVYLNFFAARILRLTVQQIELGRTRALLALLVQLREMVPVTRIGHRTYDDSAP